MVSRLSKNDLVLVTGANGYLAGHVVDDLLVRGFRVRGSVRKDCPRLNTYFDTKYGSHRFETFNLPDLSDLARCKQAVEDVSGIIHVAGDTTGSTQWEDMVKSAVRGSTTILRAAAATQTVHCVVVTSTVCAGELPRHNSPEIEVYSDTWNLAALQSLKDRSCPKMDEPTIAYAAAKTEAERACWDLMKEEKPGFVLNTVLPCYIMGPMVPPQEAPISTMGFVAKLLDNDPIVMEMFPPDIRDTALLHVAALLDTDCKYERLFSCAQPFRWTDVLDILRELRPEAVLPKPPLDEAHDGISYRRVQKRSEEVMQKYSDRRGWISLKDSIAAGIGI